MKSVVHPTYFPNIEIFKHIYKSKELVFEINDNYQKQTVRNRTSICESNGKLNLAVPVKYSSTKKDKLKDVKICNDTKWQKNHLKSIQFAYRSSPFFEFYEDEFFKIFEKKEKFLLDINIRTIELICKVLELKINYIYSEKFQEKYDGYSDFRYLTNKGRVSNKKIVKPYSQVFDYKFGFIENLSIIDLIFNHGYNTIDIINSNDKTLSKLGNDRKS
tara:strand:- start:17801 stop:18451 length:651 start_codon:yes stop_codon:yes gene_type:complete